jgi:hypothetical protein
VTLSTKFKGAVIIPHDGFLLKIIPLVKKLFANADCDLDFNQRFFEVQPQGDDRLAPRLDLLF